MHPLVSVIIDNYNYGQFLAEAIESAIGQSYANTEVIVVDDGSTDGSRQVIASYGSRVMPVLKENGGMDTAFNAGFATCKGDLIIFLDADDFLLPTAVENAVPFFRAGDTAKVHWPLWEVKANGRKTGRLVPRYPLSQGNFRDAVAKKGPSAYTSPPTSGNMWARQWVEKVFPMPETGFKRNGEMYLVTLAPLFGGIQLISEPQGFYRVHGNNDFACRPAEERNMRIFELYYERCRVLSLNLQKLGVNVSAETWMGDYEKYYYWLRQVCVALREISCLIQPGSSFILVDEDQWGERLLVDGDIIEGRFRVPFLEKRGQYWGPPADDQTAILELDRLRQLGASFLVFAWPSFWWLDHYSEFKRYLDSNFGCVFVNERLVIFNLMNRALGAIPESGQETPPDL